MLVPVSGIVVTGNASMADRYTYLTLTGVFIALTWAAHDVLGKSLRGWSFALGGAVLGICAAMSFVQAGSWENSGALWQNAIAATERNATALNGVAKDLWDHQPDRRNEALDLWRAALEASPNDYLANNNFGIALSLSGSKDVAIEYFRRAVHSHPEMAEGHVNLGSALDDLGRKAEAEQEFRECGEQLRIPVGAGGPVEGRLAVPSPRCGDRARQRAIPPEPRHGPGRTRRSAGEHRGIQGRTKDRTR
jgi:Flp pilus assembly protein TadD